MTHHIYNESLRRSNSHPNIAPGDEVVQISDPDSISFNSPNLNPEVVMSTQFNQDFSCLAVSTNLGFKIYSVAHPNKLIKLYENKEIGVVSLICMQFRTNILALVTRCERESPKTNLASRNTFRGSSFGRPGSILLSELYDPKSRKSFSQVRSTQFGEGLSNNN